MPRPPLTVRRSPTGYVMHDPALVRLAGIEAVPLPFTSLAAPATVLAHLRRFSPHREVRFDGATNPLTEQAWLSPQSPTPNPQSLCD